MNPSRDRRRSKRSPEPAPTMPSIPPAKDDKSPVKTTDRILGRGDSKNSAATTRASAPKKPPTKNTGSYCSYGGPGKKSFPFEATAENRPRYAAPTDATMKPAVFQSERSPKDNQQAAASNTPNTPLPRTFP